MRYYLFSRFLKSSFNVITPFHVKTIGIVQWYLVYMPIPFRKEKRNFLRKIFPEKIYRIYRKIVSFILDTNYLTPFSCHIFYNIFFIILLISYFHSSKSNKLKLYNFYQHSENVCSIRNRFWNFVVWVNLDLVNDFVEWPSAEEPRRIMNF